MSSPSSQRGSKSFVRQHLVALILGTLVLAAVVTFVVKALTGSKTPPRPAPMITMVSLPPPPTPPPTPPPPPPEQKVQEQEPEPKPDEPKPKEEPPKPPDAPPSLGSNIKGDGNDGFGLSGSGDGGMVGGNGNGSRWSRYGSQVQARIAEALRRNRQTRSAAMNVKVQVWPDSSGKITRVRLASSTGDAALDRTIQDEVLTGLQLSEPPPAGLPTPITLRLRASRPN